MFENINIFIFAGCHKHFLKALDQENISYNFCIDQTSKKEKKKALKKWDLIGNSDRGKDF